MAIVQIDKMTLYGAESQKDTVVDRLQALGCVHLVDLGSANDDRAVGDELSDTRDALKYLRACPEKRRQVRRSENFDRQQVVADALILQRGEQEAGDERDELQNAIRDLQPWGEFRLPADDIVGDVRFWFYVVPLRDVQKFQDIGLPLREISRDHRSAHILILSINEPQDMPGTRIDLDRRPLSELRLRLEDVEERLEEFHHERVGLTRWCDRLASALDEADDAAARAGAAGQTFNGRNVYALRGWIPRDAVDSIHRFAEENNLAVNIEPPAPDDEPPTLLHQSRTAGRQRGLGDLLQDAGVSILGSVDCGLCFVRHFLRHDHR